MNKEFLLNMIMQNPQIRNNPMAQNAIRMYQSGDVNGLNAMASNIAKEKNIDLNQFTQQIKSNIKF